MTQFKHKISLFISIDEFLIKSPLKKGVVDGIMVHGIVDNVGFLYC
jgi:hypothetical protein